MSRISSFYNNIKKNMHKVPDAILIIGSFLLAAILLVVEIFNINFPFASPLTLMILGLLAHRIYRDHQTNQTTKQITEETSGEIQKLAANQTTIQQMLQTLNDTSQHIGTHQLTIQQSLSELLGSVQSLTRNKFFEDDEEAYKYLLQYIGHSPVKEAFFLQYSCQKSAGLLSTMVLNKKARVTVFIQHEEIPEQLKSQRQVDRITSMIRNSLSDLSRKLSVPSNLKVYKYRTPATFRAVKIDDLALCVGWYTYEKVDRKNYTHFPDDQVAVSGHDRPTIVAWKGTEEFAILDKMVSEMITNHLEYAEEVQL